MLELSNIRHKDFRTLFRVLHAHGTPTPWILKRDGLERSGWRLISPGLHIHSSPLWVPHIFTGLNYLGASGLGLWPRPPLFPCNDSVSQLMNDNGCCISTPAELSPAPEIWEISQIRGTSGNSTENSTDNSVLFSKWLKKTKKLPHATKQSQKLPK